MFSFQCSGKRLLGGARWFVDLGCGSCGGLGGGSVADSGFGKAEGAEVGETGSGTVHSPQSGA